MVENVFCHTHKQFHPSHVTVPIQITVSRADFTRTSVTLQSNSIPTKYLLSAPKEVLKSKIFSNVQHTVNFKLYLPDCTSYVVGEICTVYLYVMLSNFVLY